MVFAVHPEAMERWIMYLGGLQSSEKLPDEMRKEINWKIIFHHQFQLQSDNQGFNPTSCFQHSP